jgi:hypothetical protein
MNLFLRNIFKQRRRHKVCAVEQGSDLYVSPDIDKNLPLVLLFNRW